jgi:co-chaperonin GroES (HSP10)
MVGDRVLVLPDHPREQTGSGLYLPPTVAEQEVIAGGVVMKAGPGIPIATLAEDGNEVWNAQEEKTRYMPLQVREGDHILFLQKNAYPIELEGKKYFIVPHSTILMIEREVLDLG